MPARRSFPTSMRSPSSASSPATSTPSTENSAAARSAWSPNPAAIDSMATHSSFCATPIWTRATTFLHARRFPAEPIRRHIGRPDPPRQGLLLSRLPGHPADTGHRHRRNQRAVECGSDRQLLDAAQSLYNPETGLPVMVSGPYLASLLTQKLGYTVAAGEPYY